jgi:glycosyltransferase involved in cell wall biosynthesis
MTRSSSHEEWHDRIHIRRFRRVSILAQRPWYVTPGMILAALEGEWADYDIVHAFHFVTFQALFGAFMGGLTNARFVLTPSYHPWEGAYETVVARRVIRRADAVIAQCLQERDELSSFVPLSKITTVPCGVDEDMFQRKSQTDLRSRLGFTPSDKVILYVGDLGGHKSVSKLVSIMPVILRGVPEAKLLVVGGGSGHNALRRLALSLGVDQGVKVTGQLADEDVLSAFAQSDAFALPSENESFGIVLLEAAISGLPIVSTPVGVAPELVIAGSNGYLARSCDGEFAEKLIEVLQDGKFKQNAGRMVPVLMGKYSWRTIAASLESLYQRILDDSGRGAHAAGTTPAPTAAPAVGVEHWTDAGSPWMRATTRGCALH